MRPVFDLITVSIHAPLARSNRLGRRVQRGLHVSIHAPLARSNRGRGKRRKQIRSFNTCSSCEEQPDFIISACLSMIVSIHAPLARSNSGVASSARLRAVSIHAPLARSNVVSSKHPFGSTSFNTCSSCEEQQ